MFEKIKDWYYNAWIYNRLYLNFYKKRMFSDVTDVRTRPWEFFSFYAFKSFFRSGFSIKYIRPMTKEPEPYDPPVQRSASAKVKRTGTGQSSIAKPHEPLEAKQTPVDGAPPPLVRAVSLPVAGIAQRKGAPQSKAMNPANPGKKTSNFRVRWQRLLMAHSWPYTLMLILRYSLFAAIDYSATLSWKNMASMRKRNSLNSTGTVRHGAQPWASHDSETWRKWVAVALKVIVLIGLFLPETVAIILKLLGDACLLLTNALVRAWQKLYANEHGKSNLDQFGLGFGLALVTAFTSPLWLPVALYYGALGLATIGYYTLFLLSWPLTKLIAACIEAWGTKPGSDLSYQPVPEQPPKESLPPAATDTVVSRAPLSATDVFNTGLKQLALLPFKLVKWAGLIAGFLAGGAILSFFAFFPTVWYVLRHPILTWRRIEAFVFPPQKVSEILAEKIATPLLAVDSKTGTIATDNPILVKSKKIAQADTPIKEVLDAVKLSEQQTTFTASQHDKQSQPSSWARMSETWELLFLQAQTLTCQLSDYSNIELPRANAKELTKAIKQLKSIEVQYQQHQLLQKAKETAFLAKPKQLRAFIRDTCAAFNVSHTVTSELESKLQEILTAPDNFDLKQLEVVAENIQRQLKALDEHQSQFNYLANMIDGKISELTQSAPDDEQLKTLNAYQTILQLKIIEAQEDEDTLAKMQEQILLAPKKLGAEASASLLSKLSIYGSWFKVARVPHITTPILEEFNSRIEIVQGVQAAASLAKIV